MAELIEQGVARAAGAIAANAPVGWTEAVLVSTEGLFGLNITGQCTLSDARTRSFHTSIDLQDLRDVASAVGTARGWDCTRLEIRCRPSGEYSLVASHDVVSRLHGERPGFLAVLDRNYRLSPAGYAQEEGTAGPAGDPDLALVRLRAHLERRAEILGRSETLPPPVTEAALADAERRLGRPLPADLRALYLFADGSGEDACGLFGNLGWVPLARLVAANAGLREPVWTGWENNWDAVVLDADPPGTVRRCREHPAWFPFATADDGNYLAVDMSPAHAGRTGQVIQIGRDYYDGPLYVCDSVTSLLARYLDLLDRGAYEVEGDGIDYIDVMDDSDSCESWADPELRSRGIPHEVSPAVQAVLIQVNAPTSPMDLAPLATAPHLRRLELERRPVTDLSPLRDLPVESLAVDLPGGDLAPLQGHRHLGSLDLATTTATDLTPLRTAPKLRGLDLSRAAVQDLTVLADFPHLRYLALTGNQWAVLLNEGKVPPSLAAARLAERDASRDEALSWAARLGLPVGTPFVVSGTFAADDAAADAIGRTRWTSATGTAEVRRSASPGAGRP
ncbi:SMI1/KNR4 family protein [Kitasatospora sp. MBT66]|uniref:SMI1/KNR4 family protein n=1 Tax=Kitasatospora sp. MBT66 TaxID=1444769 RepID=UPI0007C83AD1|nr:SMI1/KNR4 family protein [Kitasatospora sp. MBT66]